MPQKIDVVVGAQFGSEAKGHVTAQLVKSGLKAAAEAREATNGEIDPTVVNIRVAGPNAGHTVYDDEGQKFALRQVPVGAALADEVVLYIAPGSEIDPPVLFDEIIRLRDGGHAVDNLFVSPYATLITDEHKQAEADASLVARAGSTGKGIGAARADRLMRKAKRVIDDHDLVEKLWAVGVNLAQPEDLYADDDIAQNSWQHLIVEGTQGYGLGLHTDHYPQCTSSDTTADAFLVMAGLVPWRIATVDLSIYAVARVYPIRVAGNSGKLRGETTWEALGLPEERTTVTQLVRRVGQWDTGLVRDAVRANGGKSAVRVVVTMLDQKFPALAGLNGENVDQYDDAIVQEAEDWLASVQEAVGAPVVGFTTSPTDIAWVDGGSIQDVIENRQTGTDKEFI